MSDELILRLVKLLDGGEFDLKSESDGYKYFVEVVLLKDRSYRIILTHCDEDYLGVVNAFRVKGKIV